MKTNAPSFTNLTEGHQAVMLEEMLEKQRKAAKRIMLDIAEGAAKENEYRATFKSIKQYTRDQWSRRPHRVHFIDGPRGAGKTYLLLSIMHFISCLGPDDGRRRGDQQYVQTRKSLRTWEQHMLQTEAGPVPGICNPFDSDGGNVAIPLQTIFPADSDSESPTMEAIFAAIDARLQDERRKTEKDANGTRHKKTLELTRRLRSDVARKWLFSRNLGVQAMLDDSVSYSDFATKRTEESWAANHRIDSWRNYVNDFCEHFGVSQLVIGIDDTDVKPELTEDILHSLRMFLNHPRIITILAGNLRAMRNSLLRIEFKKLSGALSAVPINSPTASDWRRISREEIEQYLEKILPRWRRHFIGETSSTSVLRRSDKDFELIFGKTFDAVALSMLNRYRPEYLLAKGLATLQLKLLGHDRPTQTDRPEFNRETFREAKDDYLLTTNDRHAIEQFVSWWLLRHNYAEFLRPTTVRQLVSLHRYISGAEVPVGNSNSVHSKKRLAVMIFESPDNSLLTTRFDDHDHNILEWLTRQDVSATWLGRRKFLINGRAICEHTYSYEAICFRLDLSIALPLRHVEPFTFPRELLPRIAGSSDVPPLWRPRGLAIPVRYGLAKELRMSVVPLNCLYLSDLRALPDTAFQTTEQTYTATAASTDKDKSIDEGGVPFESQLADNPLAIFGDRPDSPRMLYVMNWLAPILRQVRSRFISAGWSSTVDTSKVTVDERAWHELLANRDNIASSSPLGALSLVRRAAIALGDKTREPEYGEPDSGSETYASDKDNRRRRTQNQDQLRFLGQYAAIYSSLRCCWHATRIYLASISKAANPNQRSALEANFTDVIGSDFRAESAYMIGADRLSIILSSNSDLRDSLLLAGTEFPNSDLCADIYALARWKKPSTSLPSRYQALFLSANSSSTEQARYYRIARHFLLYMYAIAPDLPALIRVDCSILLGIGNPFFNTEPQLNEIQACINKWKQLVGQCFNYLMQLEQEVAKILLYMISRATETVAGKEGIKEQLAQRVNELRYPALTSALEEIDTSRIALFTFAPDISAATLFGYAGINPGGDPGMFLSVRAWLAAAHQYLLKVEECVAVRFNPNA